MRDVNLSPECKCSSATVRSHLVREKLSRECERNGTDAETKGDPESQKEEDGQVVQRWICNRKLEIVVQAKKNHDHSNGEATDCELGPSVDP